MKKLILALLVVALAIPAMAADISLTDNGDGTGTIVLTVTGTEVVRGLAIVVAADADVTAVAGTDAIFNVFMDAAYDAELAVPGSYALGTGSPVANPAAVGGIALPAASISLCMGVLDQAGLQGGAAVGTYNVATITTGAATVVITADTLRGGIVGDDLVAPVIAGGPITDAPATCVNASAPFYADWLAFGSPDCWCYQKQCRGDADGLNEGTAFFGIRSVYTQDLNILLSAYGVKEPTKGPGILSVANGICADFDHLPEGTAFFGIRRVYTQDLNIFLSNYGVKEPTKGPGVPVCSGLGTDINFWTN